MINAFSTQDNTDMRGKVLVRLKSITDLQSQLSRCLAAMPVYTPPLAHFDADSLFETADGVNVSGDKHARKSGKKG